jgi:hypothetical protein
MNHPYHTKSIKSHKSSKDNVDVRQGMMNPMMMGMSGMGMMGMGGMGMGGFVSHFFVLSSRRESGVFKRHVFEVSISYRDAPCTHLPYDTSRSLSIPIPIPFSTPSAVQQLHPPVCDLPQHV